VSFVSVCATVVAVWANALVIWVYYRRGSGRRGSGVRVRRLSRGLSGGLVGKREYELLRRRLDFECRRGFWLPRTVTEAEYLSGVRG